MRSRSPGVEPPAARAFTDGACIGNPGPGGWAAIVLAPDGRVRELGGGEARTTNNRMELRAAVEALKAAPAGAVEVLADSSYLALGASAWLRGWKRRGWVRPDGAEVLNRDLWEALDALLAARPPGSVRWLRVPGHAGVPGNERADAIALAFAEGRREPLYDGPAAAYPIDLAEGCPEPDAPSSGRAAGPEKGYPVYLSLVAGALRRHAAWKECEAVVKGAPGARFKKVRSSVEETQTLRDWGVRR